MTTIDAPWTNRITGYGTEAPDQLAANPKNWRAHPKHQQAALKGALDSLGWIQNVIVNQRTGFVLDGHARIALALRHNQPEIPVTYVDLSEADEALALATLDPISAMAGADKDQLEALLADIATQDEALLEMIAGLGAEHGIGLGTGVGLTDPDEVPEPPAEPITKPGDLWLLGEHRLLCGDATVAEDIDRLMDGETAQAVFTDPPYGMDYHGVVFGKKGIANDTNLTFEATLTGAVANMAAVAADAVVAICFGAARLDRFFAAVPQLRFHRLLTIYKPNGMAKPWHGWIMTSEHIALFSLGTPTWVDTGHSHDVYVHDYSERPDRDVDHPTVKPLSIVQDVIEKTSQEGFLVLDLFGGSGTTVIACEETARRCAMMEIDPTYCDVIVRRWENFTGQTASRERIEDAA